MNIRVDFLKGPIAYSILVIILNSGHNSTNIEQRNRNITTMHSMRSCVTKVIDVA